MDVVVERCAGLDIHKDTVVACTLVGPADGRARKEVRTFSTMTSKLCELKAWLAAQGCTQVGMESTGCYWRPVYEVLESGPFELVVGNAQHMKNVPGRKTDVKDAEWIARLIRMGLVHKSFVPPREQRERRDLVRYRKSLIRTRTDERNRLQKLLQTANIKLGSVASDVFGMSGTRMLEALAAGEVDPATLADLALGHLREKRPALIQALSGRVGDHHRAMLKIQLARLERMDEDIKTVEAEIERRLEPYRPQRQLLMTIPGIKGTVAAGVLAEIGPHVDTFPSDRHLCAWAGLAPGNNESAGKKLGGRARKGNLFVKGLFIEAAQTAIRKKGSYLRNKFHRLKARRGYMKALIAIARKLCVATFHILKRGVAFKDLGEQYLDLAEKKRTTRSLVRRLEQIGWGVSLTAAQG